MTSYLSTNKYKQMPSIHDLTNTATTTTTLSSLSTEEDAALVQCPTCETKLHRSEVATHCEQEMQRLKEISSQPPPPAGESQNLAAEEEGGTTSSNGQTTPATSERPKPWSVFQRVQKNRQSRMKQRTRKRHAIPEHPCPVCNVNFPQDEIQQHAESCLRRSNGTANGRSNSDDQDHSSNDEEGGGGEEYEEYEWAGQKRIRVSSLLQGGYAALGIGQAIRNGGSSSSSGSNRINGNNDEDEDDEDLNVDEDDTQIYGPEQYCESDVVSCVNEDESDITSYMRRLITAGSGNQLNNARDTNTTTTDSLNISSSILNNDGKFDKLAPTSSAASTSSAIEQSSTTAQYQQIIDSLKMKLQHYEQQHIPGKYKCLICLDDYRNPAISVACWHVHCEQCWLRSLGARKLCPQCNLITTPKDLRRIYM